MLTIFVTGGVLAQDEPIELTIGGIATGPEVDWINQVVKPAFEELMATEGKNVTVTTGSYLVEAIRARKGLRQPYLRAIIRFHERKPDIIELVIVNISEIAALDVTISLNPLPTLFENNKDNFPLRTPILDRQFPF